MNNSIIIRTASDAEGLIWAVRQSDTESFHAGLYAVDVKAIRETPPSSLLVALRHFVRDADYHLYEIDWSSYRLAAGYHIEVTRDAKWMAGAMTEIFETQAEYDTYRTELLRQQYKDDLDYEEGEQTVDELLEAGDLNAAWNLAISDEDGSRELWQTNFGNFCIERNPVTVAFSDLPEWMRAIITNSLRG